MKQNEDECYDYAKLIDPSFELFIQSYNSLKRIDYQDEPSMEDISDINTLSQEIGLTIQDIESKIKMARTIISECSLNHEQLKKDITSKETSALRLKTRFLKEREDIMKFLSHYVPKESSSSWYGYDNNVGDKDLSEYNMDELMLEEEKLTKVKEYVYEKEHGLSLSSEDKKQIIQLKNQIQELMGMVKVHIDQASENLVKVEDNVDDAYLNIQKSNKELREAALIQNKTKRMKYQAILGTVLGAAGSFLPGIGNVLGVALGVGIGAGIAKIEEKAIRKIGQKKTK